MNFLVMMGLILTKIDPEMICFRIDGNIILLERRRKVDGVWTMHRYWSGASMLLVLTECYKDICND